MVDGLEVLVRQGARSLELLDRPRAPVEAMREAASSPLSSTSARPKPALGGLPICEAMAVSRPFLLALIGIALLGATVFAVQNAPQTPDERGGARRPPQAQQQPADGRAAAVPEQSLEAAFTNDDLGSASFDAELSFSAQGERNSSSPTAPSRTVGPRTCRVRSTCSSTSTRRA